ncbi:peptide ABC transporter substrate-binding protein [Verrucomicrobiota bacterium]|nr:peptide ABC transporter substrate-binding protein [Verrucomicrobiota bacterium]
MKAHPPPNSPRPRARRGLNASFVWLALLLFAATALLALAAAPPTGKVLVVNSDASVARYAEVRNAFKETLGADALREVDLSKVGEAGLRRALAADNPGILYCIGGNAYQSAAKLARGRSIILSTAINWERFKPDPRTTRVIANELPAVAQLTLFRHFFPQLQRVGVVYNPAINKQWFEQAVAAGKEVGVEVIGRIVTRSSQVGSALAELTPKVDALWLTPDPVVLENEVTVKLYFSRADAARKPVFAYSASYVEVDATAKLGATLVLAPDVPTTGRQAASIAQDFAGAPAVTTPAGSEVTLNLKRVQHYGLQFNRDALDSVNNLLR